MSTSQPLGFHQSSRQLVDHPGSHSAHPHPARLPVIPDLRFEYSYLRSIQRYVTIRRQQPSDHPEQRREDNGFEKVGRDTDYEPRPSSSNAPSEVIEIQWGRVAWITTRDQVISPLLQGALWALASYFLTPFSAQLGAKMGNLAHTRFSPSEEGPGVGWLRRWIVIHRVCGVWT
ncbi:hypothetical protein LshimejAT787_1101930 [Lyophyllum shimeji]|uniref:Uncharacterized protein n=1 Tax=Lyophyllum shimeji TaxID=47721 RepID=A0A9P3PUC1_LYOSH|nr:hypothetical protein LshimejAT787_1101930 [Lyophyllum shimeji]